MECKNISETSSSSSEETQSDTASYSSETSESYVSDSEASLTLNSSSSSSSAISSSSEDDVDGNSKSRNAGPRPPSRRRVQQDQVGTEGADKSQSRGSSEEASEEVQAGSSDQKKASKRGASSEISGGSEEKEGVDEVGYYKGSQEKVDLLCRWRWDDFKDRDPKAEVLSDYVWGDFIPSPTTFEYPIRIKEHIPKVRILHSEEGSNFFIRPICHWAVASYAMDSSQSHSMINLRGIYNEIYLFLGSQPQEAFSGDVHIQAMRQKDLFGTYLEGDSKGMPLGGETCGLKAVWLDFLPKRKILVSEYLLKSIAIMIGIKFAVDGETTAFYNFMKWRYSQKQYQHKIAGLNCSYCVLSETMD